MSAADVRIVRAEPGRIPDVEPLWKAMHAVHAEGRPGAAEVRPFRSPEESWRRKRARYEKWLAGEDAFMLLADHEEGVVGYAMVTIGGAEASIETGERVAQLAALSVLPEARRQGIGRRLVEAMYEELRARGVRELTLGVMDGNRRAMRFYERLGLRPYLTEMVGLVPEAPPGEGPA